MTDQLSFPPAVHTDTSIEAAEAIKPHAVSLRERVWQYIDRHPLVTDQEIADNLGLPENTIRPRRVELEKAGRVFHAGYGRTASGRRARTWVAS